MDKILPKPKNSRRNESKYTIEHPNHTKVLKSFVAYVRMRAEKKREINIVNWQWTEKDQYQIKFIYRIAIAMGHSGKRLAD